MIRWNIAILSNWWDTTVVGWGSDIRCFIYLYIYNLVYLLSRAFGLKLDGYSILNSQELILRGT